MTRRRASISASLLTLALLMPAFSGCGSDSSSSSGTAPSHIFFIMMENHGTSQIIGNTADAPYINQLANQYGVATNYFGVTHPSLPNYLAMVSGDFQGIWDDCKAGMDVTCAPEEFVSGPPYNGQLLTADEVTSATNTQHWFTGSDLVDQLESHHRTWKAYMQSMPSVGFPGEYYPLDTVNGQQVSRKLYAQKHDPFMYFADIRNSASRMQLIVPFTQFDQDIAAANVPDFVWITPDQCNDMHGLSADNAAAVGIPDCATPSSGLDDKVIALGDDFLNITVGKIMSSPLWMQNSAIVIAWDEDDYEGYTGCCRSPTGMNGITLGGANAPAIIIRSDGAKHLVSETPYNHYSLLATIEHLWNLGCLANTCEIDTSGLMTEFF